MFKKVETRWEICASTTFLSLCNSSKLLLTEVEEPEEDLSGLHPGALLYRSAALQNFPIMADALAHGADANWVNVAEESSTPLIQAVSAVRTVGSGTPGVAASAVPTLTHPDGSSSLA